MNEPILREHVALELTCQKLLDAVNNYDSLHERNKSEGGKAFGLVKVDDKAQEFSLLARNKKFD